MYLVPEDPRVVVLPHHCGFSHDASYLRQTRAVVEEASRGSPTLATPGSAAELLAGGTEPAVSSQC